MAPPTPVGSAPCPTCGGAARKIKRVTLEQLLRKPSRRDVGDGQYHVCAAPACPTVYFSEAGHLLDETSLSVPFGLKQNGRPRKICYCFGHTIDEIHGEIARTAQSTVRERIERAIGQQGCRCEYTNPLGCCCLSTIKAAVDEGFRLAGKAGVTREATAVIAAGGHSLGEAAASPGGDCCDSNRRRASAVPGNGRLAAVGSVVAASLSSACCWLPLALLAFGASAAGAAAFFEQWRPVFASVATALLAWGFYRVYGAGRRCARGSCGAASTWSGRLNRGTLWVAAAAVVTMVFFPSYVQHLYGAAETMTEEADQDRSQSSPAC